jgi:flagellar hook-length control protein FliK
LAIGGAPAPRPEVESMMLSLPPTLAEADAARSPKPPAVATEPGKDRDFPHPFALLLAADEPAPEGMLTPAGDAGVASGLEDASAEVLIAAPEAGKLVPLIGEQLPPSQRARGPALSPGGQSGATGDSPLTRMIDMLRTLHGLVGPAVGEGETPLQVRPELKALELSETVRLLTSTTGAQYQAPVPATTVAAGTPLAAAAAPPSVPISVALGRPDWSEAVGQRVLWMLSNNTKVAELRLNPPELGPVEVRVRTDDDGVRLNLAAGNAAVREALEAAAPRLREMLLAEGLRLEHMDIGQQHAGAGQHSDPEPTARHHGADGDDVDAPERAAGPSRAGLVDCFV